MFVEERTKAGKSVICAGDSFLYFEITLTFIIPAQNPDERREELIKMLKHS